MKFETKYRFHITAFESITKLRHLGKYETKN